MGSVPLLLLRIPVLKLQYAAVHDYLQVQNPATGEVVATVANMKGSETSAAIAAALSAFPEWKSKVAKERSKLMRKW